MKVRVRTTFTKFSDCEFEAESTQKTWLQMSITRIWIRVASPEVLKQKIVTLQRRWHKYLDLPLKGRNLWFTTYSKAETTRYLGALWGLGDQGLEKRVLFYGVLVGEMKFLWCRYKVGQSFIENESLLALTFFDDFLACLEH